MTVKKLRPIGWHEYGKAGMLQVQSAFTGTPDSAARQKAIDYLVRLHGMSLATTKSLRYDPGFNEKDGRNVKGNIRIGPSAFAQDSAWLANVVFHETVHSDQFLTYDQQGVVTINPQKTQPERILVALDEYEAFYWSWFNRQPLGLDTKQIAALQRELALWEIEIDDKPTIAFARQAQFDEARLALIGQLPGASQLPRAGRVASATARASRIPPHPLSSGRKCCQLFG